MSYVSYINSNRWFSIVVIFSFLFFHTIFCISQNSLDQLQYNYNNTTNQLNFITEGVSSTVSTVDLDNQIANNYEYDKNGQLIKDRAEGIEEMSWTFSGKVKQVNIDDDGDAVVDRIILFKYDAAGNRVKKIESTVSTASSISTYYIRNALGEVISIYKDEGSGTERKEMSCVTGNDEYASTRLATEIYTRDIGYKRIELSDHLGNIKMVLTDVKNQISDTTFSSTIQETQDYYNYGMFMPGRQLSADQAYRYGLNGKERDDEIKGNGNSYDFGARLYDSRVGRWLSIDPYAEKFPALSSYVGNGNNPINITDPDGNEPKWVSANYAKVYYGYSSVPYVSGTNTFSIGTYLIVPKYYEVEGKMVLGHFVACNTNNKYAEEWLIAPTGINDFYKAEMNTDFWDETVFGGYQMKPSHTAQNLQTLDQVQWYAGDFSGALSTEWKASIKDPGFWLNMSLSMGGTLLGGAKMPASVAPRLTSNEILATNSVIREIVPMAEPIIVYENGVGGTALKYGNSAVLAESGFIDFELNVARKGGGIGGAMIDDAIGTFKKNGYTVKGVNGNWGPGALGDNYDAFYKAYNSGMTASEAAFQTPTGKICSRLGYKNVEILNVGAEVKVRFYE